jgi:Cu/Zn superoxide dismutase
LSVSEERRRRIVYRLNRVATMVFGATLLASLILGGNALAKDTKSIKLHLTPSRDSGVSGKAILTDVEGGVKVELSMKGLPEEGVKHINHIHGGGTCADDRDGRTAPVTIPLNTVVANADGIGSATTTIKDVTLEELLGDDQHRFILLHAKVKKGEGVPPGISCADLPQKSTNTTFENLPSSGGLPPVVLRAIPLVMLLVSVSTVVMLLRRTA